MNVWDVVDLILKVDMSDDPDPKNTFFFFFSQMLTEPMVQSMVDMRPYLCDLLKLSHLNLEVCI